MELKEIKKGKSTFKHEIPLPTPEDYTVLEGYNKFLVECASKIILEGKYTFEFCRQFFPIQYHKLKKIDLEPIQKKGNEIYNLILEVKSNNRFKNASKANEVVREMETIISKYKPTDIFFSSPNFERAHIEMENYIKTIVNLYMLSYYVSRNTKSNAQANSIGKFLVKENEANQAKVLALRMKEKRREEEQKEKNLQTQVAKQQKEDSEAKLAAEELRKRALEEEKKERELLEQQQKEQRNQIERERQEYLQGLPPHIPRTNQSDWLKVKSATSFVGEKRFTGDYHKEGICEANFSTFAKQLTDLLQSKRYYAAILQLEKCIKARQDTYDDPKYADPRQNRSTKGLPPTLENEKHRKIIFGLQNLRQKLIDIGLDQIDSIDYVEGANPSFLINQLANKQETVYLLGGHRRGKTAKKSYRKKTRKVSRL